jgi:LDH2 family malate/lactate/ureidoglycolate dehydrogenase
VQAGEIIATARPQVLEETETTALVKGNWAFGQVTGNFAADLAADKAKKSRVAAVSVVEAGHTGRLAYFIERAARRGVALFWFLGTVGNFPAKATAPYGGARAVFGTNPIAMSIPNPVGAPVTLDYATSAIAAGKIKQAKAKHEQLPPDSILDKYGRPSTDPEAFYDGGMLLSFGKHKGYCLAVMGELLSRAVTGSDAFPGKVQRCGIFSLAVDVAAFRPLADYNKTMSNVIGHIKAVPPAPGFDAVLIPGEPEDRTRAERESKGIPIPEDTWDAVKATGAGLGVDIDAVAKKRT